MTSAAPSIVDAPPASSRREDWATTLCTWGLMLSWSLARVPIPGINESHYLGKAKHFWNPQWCAGDLFLESANPHGVFYATCGWLTLFLTLPQTAVVLRAVGLLVLAIGWQSLSRALLHCPDEQHPVRRWGGCLAMCCLLLLNVLGNWSGEWLVGGAESRLFAYGLLFWGWGQSLSGRRTRAAAALGLAVSFHPIIGAWGVLATLFAAAARPSQSPSRREIITSTLLTLTCATPGLCFAFTTLKSAHPADALFADQLQVADRLRHHLDPMAIPLTSYRDFGFQLVVLWLLARSVAWTAAQRHWRSILGASLLFAAVGFLVGWGPRPIADMPGWTWRIRLLKFYPFRLADVLVPVTVSLLAAEHWLKHAAVEKTRTWLLVPATALALAFLVPYPDAQPSRLHPAERQALVEAYTWLQQNSAPNALCQAVDVDWGLRWYAQRPEFVSNKDMPQDTASLMRWNDRQWVIFRWKVKAEQDSRITPSELHDLAASTGIEYAVLRKRLPGTGHTRAFDAPAAFENRHFRVERLQLPATTP